MTTFRVLKKERQEKYFHAIVFPIYGAIALLDSADIELEGLDSRGRGINLAAAFRTPRAMWSLYDHLWEYLTKKQRKQIENLLRYLEDRLKDFEDDTHRTDGWDDAMRYYNFAQEYNV